LRCIGSGHKSEEKSTNVETRVMAFGVGRQAR
jgi:hypothetical protein